MAENSTDDPARARVGRSDPRPGLLAAGGLLGALAAASCCILPLALFSLGVGGAWIGTLAALEAYQPILVVLTLGLLGVGFHLAHRRPAADCDGGSCARPLPRHLTRLGLWAATLLVAAAIAFPLVAPRLLGV